MEDQTDLGAEGLMLEAKKAILEEQHRRPGSHVPYKSLVELRATYMPDAARAAFRSAPN